MTHPFERIPESMRRRVVLWSLGLLALATAGIGYVDTRYRVGPAAHGIVALELAGTPAAAQSILDAWSEHIGMNLWVAFGLGYDYLYLVVYGVAFSVFCAAMTTRLAARGEGFARVGRVVTWLQLVAPLCDAVENGAMLAMLTRAGTNPYAQVATGFALVKFACLAAGLSLLVFGALVPKRAS